MAKGRIEYMIVGFIVALFLGIILFFGAGKISDTITSANDFTGCQGSVAATKVAGMCVPENTAGRICGGDGEFTGIGEVFKGCPDKGTKNVFGRKRAKDYSMCCFPTYCSLIEDVEEVGSKEVKLPRLPAIFDESIYDDLENKENYDQTTKDFCLGFSLNCQEEDGCCCIAARSIGAHEEQS